MNLLDITNRLAVLHASDSLLAPEAVRPDLQGILGGLKDFQRRTVDYVFQRLYEDRPGTRRFLIADEVGLGKTLVARGVIARAIDRLWDQQEHITIVYICSNANIARQNIRRLNVTGQKGEPASRITLLPVSLSSLRRKMNFVSFTPGTSFDMKSNLGIAEERAILYCLLERAWGIRNRDSALSVLKGNKNIDGFESLIHKQNPLIDPTLSEAFTQMATEAIDLRDRFNWLRGKLGSGRCSEDLAHERNLWVGEMRTLLARSCLSALRPDLIILDEFQRFKHLLGNQEQSSELSELAHDFFQYEPARVLLLSATPYKMYTLNHEADTDDHYKDFVQTLRFLAPDPARLEEILRDWRRELLRLDSVSLDRLRDVRSELQERLRWVMVRTERLAGSEDRDGMLREVPASEHLKLETSDLEHYLVLQEVAQMLKCGETLEYWKAAPYLLNFMEDYELERSFRRELRSEQSREALVRLLRDSSGLLLSWKAIEAYRAVDAGNARLRGLAGDTVGAGWWRLLWVPPSLPYYRLSGPFTTAVETGCTKRLVFSSWRVVPKVIATLLSYEAERQMIRTFQRAPRNTTEARKKRRPLLRFTSKAGQPTGMPVLGLLYPCMVLAREGDPLRFQAGDASANSPPTRKEMLQRVRAHLQPRLRRLVKRWASGSAIDESWYWAAPVLLDLAENEAAVREWFGRPDLPEKWSGKTISSGTADHESRWDGHVQEVRILLDGGRPLGHAPADLEQVVAEMALASLGTAALRSLSRVTGGSSSLADEQVRDAAGRIAWCFLSLFNLPEVTALVRGHDRSIPYWRRALRYSVIGCLQAVLDEYAHMLNESLAVQGESPGIAAARISEAIRSALTLRTSTLGAEEVEVEGGKVQLRERGLRGRFAMRLGDEKADEGGEVTRADQVREAFNSPFWPFVLATTSIGQEGLDFHPYCHAVVHWNLPANPVDLEQREGRVHRYKGHAVRKNLARQHRIAALASSGPDPWEVLFEEGCKRRSASASDLTPFWVYPLEGGAAIERHVPALPLSRDGERLLDLRRSLAVYRMVFGQYRQEDLVAYLRQHCSEEQIRHFIRELRIDLGPPET